MAQKKQRPLLLPPSLRKLFREIRDMSLDEVRTRGEQLRPVLEQDYVVGRLDPFVQKVLVLKTKKGECLDACTEDDFIQAHALMNEVQLLDDIFLFLINAIPLPEELREQVLDRYIRKGFIFVCKEPSGGNGKCEDLNVEIECEKEQVSEEGGNGTKP